MQNINTTDTQLANLYQNYLEKLSSQDIDDLSQTKRFTELYAGIPEFRKDILNNIDVLPMVAAKYHLTIDLDKVMPWICHRFAHDQLPVELADKYHQAPDNHLLRKWIQYRHFLAQLRQAYRTFNDTSQHNPNFQSWRQRQINRCDDSLKLSAEQITHPSFTFELSDGCSVGCWFCGIAADKFKGYFCYDQKNKQLWQDILKILRELFGVTSLQSAFCYWATDPTDNPDYLHFIKDFYDIVGIIPQSTLARPVKDLNWTRSLLEFSAKDPSIVNRFSITSLNQLKAVYEAFSPRDLFQVELVMQHKQAKSSIIKSNSGRARYNQQCLSNPHDDKNKKLANKSQLGLSDQHTTIACVSGFLINLCQRKIQLISPCVASSDFPLGYKVHDTDYFDTAQTLKKKINSLVEKHMSPKILKDNIIRFREDLHYIENTDGFSLKNTKRFYHVHFGDSAKIIGKLIQQAQNISVTELMEKSTEQGANILFSTSIINDLYRLGLLSDNLEAAKI